MPNDPPISAKPKRQIRKWIKRILGTALAIFLLLLAFHRPIIHWVLESIAPRVAKKADYELDWKVKGDLWSELGFQEVTVKGPEDSPLRTLTIQDFNALYSLPKLYSSGLGEFLASVKLEDATLELDLTLPSPEKPKKEKKPKSTKEGFPDFWVGGLHLRNITLKLITNAGIIEVKNFTLTLAEDQVGELSFDQLLIPQAKIQYGRVQGETFLKDRTVSLKNIRLDQNLQLRHLVVALADFSTETVGFDVDLENYGGRIALEGKALHLKSSPAVDAKIQVEQVTEKALQPWVKLPDHLMWTLDRLQLTAQGPMLEPQKLVLAADLQVSKVLVQDFHIQSAQMKSTLEEGGLFKIQSFEARTGENKVQLQASTQLPPKWQDMKSIDAKASYEIDAPLVSQFWIVNPLVQLAAQAQGSVVIEQNQPVAGAHKIHVEDFLMKALHVKSLDATLQLAPKAVKIASLQVAVDEKNKLSFSGDYQFPPTHRIQGKLDTDLEYLPSLLNRLGVSLPEPIRDGSLHGSVDLDLALNEVRKQHFEGSSAAADLQIASLETSQIRIPKAALQIEVKNQQANIQSFTAQINDRDQLDFRGIIHLKEKLNFESNLSLAIHDAKTLTKFVKGNQEVSAQGSLQLEVNASGSIQELKEKNFSNLKSDLQLHSPGIEWGEGKLKGVAISLQVEKEIARIQQLNIELDEQQGLSANGWVNLTEDMEFDAAMKAHFPKLTALNPWMENFKQAPIESGSLELDWSGSGKIKSKDVLGKAKLNLKKFKTKALPKPIELSLQTDHDLKTAQIAPLDFHFGTFHLQLHASASEELLDVPTLKLSSQEKVWLDGKIRIPLVLQAKKSPPSSEKTLPIDLEREIVLFLHSEKLSFRELFQSLGIKPPVEGAMELDVDLKGKLRELTGEALVKVHQIQAEATKGKLPPADATLIAKVAPGQIQAELELQQKPLQTLTAKVDLPLQLENLAKNPKLLETLPLRASVKLPKSDLAFVKSFAPIVKSIQGDAEIDLNIGGTIQQPNWQGAILANIPDANFTKPQLPEIKNFRGEITFKDHSIQIQRIATSLAGGQVQLDGTIDAKNLKNPNLDIRLTASEALLVRDETMSMRANANLNCRGTLEQASVTGTIDLVRGRVFKEIEFLPLSLPNQLPPPPPTVTRSKAQSVGAPPPFANWQFDIAIRTKDQIRLLGNVLNGGVAVDLRARGNGAQPILEGEVNLVGARLRLPFSRLAFSRGRVIFSKDKFLQPELDIQGDAVVNQYEVTVYATGSAFNPQLRMTSSPPLSEGDIATLLATGSTSGDLRSSEGMAANRAAFLLISQTYRKLFRKTQPVRYDEEPPKLSFNFSLLNTGSSQRSVSAVYELSPKLQAVGTVGEKGTFRGLLYYLVRFR